MADPGLCSHANLDQETERHIDFDIETERTRNRMRQRKTKKEKIPSRAVSIKRYVCIYIFYFPGAHHFEETADTEPRGTGALKIILSNQSFK